MDDSLHAARMGDLILHPPLMAELVSGLVEAAVYAAAVAAVGAAIGGAVVAVVGTGGAAAVLTPLIAGAMVSAASLLPGGEDKSIGDRISDFSNWVGNSLFPPEPYGAISEWLAQHPHQRHLRRPRSRGERWPGRSARRGRGAVDPRKYRGVRHGRGIHGVAGDRPGPGDQQHLQPTGDDPRGTRYDPQAPGQGGVQQAPADA
ncbi:hypothetical protein [Pseudomonas hunanensis]|uniref:hypothetical protein n=1 Tax=Pseudomonas hunanensis TaxID=1247546 RepID=UPI002404F0EE|nr:hypothetical protein [Pseudomonas hunanensis]MDF9755954.1 hypothetical protein [Pseudomonas hunanensis]